MADVKQAEFSSPNGCFVEYLKDNGQNLVTIKKPLQRDMYVTSSNSSVLDGGNVRYYASYYDYETFTDAFITTWDADHFHGFDPFNNNGLVSAVPNPDFELWFYTGEDYNEKYLMIPYEYTDNYFKFRSKEMVWHNAQGPEYMTIIFKPNQAPSFRIYQPFGE